MAEQNQIISSDVTKFNVTTKKMSVIKWIIEKVSKIPNGTETFSPDFYLTPENMCYISFRKTERLLYIYISNKSATNIEVQRVLYLSDCDNETLHEDRDENNFSIKKGQFVDVISRTRNRRSFDSLPNDTLIINLWVSVKNDAIKKSHRFIRDTDPERKLREDLMTMLENPINADVSVQVGGERIPAHWSVLCSRSPYFKRMFDSGMRESVQNSIIITDSSLGTIKKLMQFLYIADFIQEDDLQELFDLYYAADKYEVLDLRTLCGHEIVSKFTVENACEILHLAHNHNDKALKMEAMDFIRSNSDAVFQTEGWKKFEVSEPVMAELVSFLLKKNRFT